MGTTFGKLSLDILIWCARSLSRMFPQAGRRNDQKNAPMISRTYDTRFILRLDEPSQTKLQQLVKHFDVSKAEIIRQLIAQANAEDFPKSWEMRALEGRERRSRR